MWQWYVQNAIDLWLFFLSQRIKNACVSFYSPPQCIDPTSSVPNGDDDGVSHTVLATAVVVPLGLVLLTIAVVLVVVLLYIWLVRRGRSRRRARDGNKSHDVAENNGAIGEAEPYG